MREIRPSGSEGGVGHTPYPYPYQGGCRHRLCPSLKIGQRDSDLQIPPSYAKVHSLAMLLQREDAFP